MSQSFMNLVKLFFAVFPIAIKCLYFIFQDKDCYVTKNGKDLAEVEMCGVDKVSDKGSDEEELKYEPTDSDY